MYNLKTLYRLKLLPLQKGMIDAHDHVSWLFDQEIYILENQIKNSMQFLPDPIDQTGS